jgi:putative phosphoribosyl transferase
MRFKDRADAGRKLAAALLRYRDENPIIMALPRGGVPVAAEVARALKAPLGLILVRKIGAPSQPELALGAVVDGNQPVVVRNPNVMAWTGTSDEEFERLCRLELAEIERRRDRFLDKRPALKPDGRTTIVIDDGIATGATTRVALQAMRMHHPKKLVLAVPVAASGAMKELRELADDVVCLRELEPMGSVSMFYDDFKQLSDREVTDILGPFSEAARSERQSPVDAAAVRRAAGDIEETKIAAILRLKPTLGEIEEAAEWALGRGDVLSKSGRALRGKIGAIYDLLTAEDEEQTR